MVGQLLSLNRSHRKPETCHYAVTRSALARCAGSNCPALSSAEVAPSRTG
jgi:hypothetical protein